MMQHMLPPEVWQEEASTVQAMVSLLRCRGKAGALVRRAAETCALVAGSAQALGSEASPDPPAGAAGEARVVEVAEAAGWSPENVLGDCRGASLAAELWALVEGAEAALCSDAASEEVRPCVRRCAALPRQSSPPCPPPPRPCRCCACVAALRTGHGRARPPLHGAAGDSRGGSG